MAPRAVLDMSPLWWRDCWRFRSHRGRRSTRRPSQRRCPSRRRAARPPAAPWPTRSLGPSASRVTQTAGARPAVGATVHCTRDGQRAVLVRSPQLLASRPQAAGASGSCIACSSGTPTEKWRWTTFQPPSSSRRTAVRRVARRLPSGKTKTARRRPSRASRARTPAGRCPQGAYRPSRLPSSPRRSQSSHRARRAPRRGPCRSPRRPPRPLSPVADAVRLSHRSSSDSLQ